MKKWLALCVLGLTGCGAELERSSEVETLRVLGIHKTTADGNSGSYVRAGDQVTFSMLWHDPDGRDITPVWFAVTEAELALLGSVVEHCENPADPSTCSCNPLSDECTSEVSEPAWDVTDKLMPLCANPERDTYYECLLLHSVLADPAVRAIASNPGPSITLNVPSSTVRPPLASGSELPAEFRLPSLKECGAVDEDFQCESIYHEPPEKSLPNFG